jgi:hypothetical protein
MLRNRRQFAQLGAAALAAGLAGSRLARAQDDALPPNVFISPSGQPFRAPMSAPYPVVDWFRQANKKGDGQLTHAEFVADAAAFFDVLDRSHQGVLEPYDIEVYEHRIAPEVLGYRVNVTASAAERKLWRAQYAPNIPFGGPGSGMGDPGTPHGDYDHENENNEGRGPPLEDESGLGAGPYSFFAAPEPITEADIDLRGFVKKANFLQLADRHFSELDSGARGFLTLDKLPKTKVQALLERAQRRRL